MSKKKRYLSQTILYARRSTVLAKLYIEQCPEAFKRLDLAETERNQHLAPFDRVQIYAEAFIIFLRRPKHHLKKTTLQHLLLGDVKSVFSQWDKESLPGRADFAAGNYDLVSIWSWKSKEREEQQKEKKKKKRLPVQSSNAPKKDLDNFWKTFGRNGKKSVSYKKLTEIQELLTATKKQGKLECW